MDRYASAPLPMLAAPLLSGKAREDGFDGTALMESTTADAPLAVQCAHASRGLVAIDRASWAQCTGKPAPVNAPAGQPSEHKNH